MTKHVVLLTNAHEAPSAALASALDEAGVAAFVEGMREMEASAPLVASETAGGETAPLAVLYEVIAGADMRELYGVVEHASAIWPGAPLVACRRPKDNQTAPSLRVLDAPTLKRLGFRAIADEPAQLHALLREIEDRGGVTAELHLPEGLERGWPAEAAAPLPPKLSRDRLRLAFELVASLHFTNEQTGAANAALAGLSRLIAADRWTIYLTAETDGKAEICLEPLAVWGRTTGEQPPPEEQDWQRALLGNALSLSGSESKVAHEAVVNTLALRRSESGRRVVAVPLMSNDRVMGVIEGVREGSGRRGFTQTDVQLLDALALPVAYALGNAARIAEAERLSQTDDLTKLHNARYLRQYLLSEVRRARRYDSSVSVLFFDLDDFKNVNDQHGHLVGSHVLMEMAAIILSSVRDTDVVARYGGDEFVVVLPESQVEQAEFVAERVRRRIELNNFTGGRGLQLRLTASFGIATFPGDAQSPQQLVAGADAAMYEAKAAGKNCIRLAAATLARS